MEEENIDGNLKIEALLFIPNVKKWKYYGK